MTDIGFKLQTHSLPTQAVFSAIKSAFLSGLGSGSGLARCCAVLTLVLISACTSAHLKQIILSDSQFEQVVPQTWTSERVLQHLGKPWRTVEFARSDTVAWDYRYTDSWGYRAEYSIIFDRGGIVVGKAHTRLERDRFGVPQ
jgi:hypothetical protein